MPKSLPTLRLAPACLGALVLIGCFGSEPDDSPYTLPRGESVESIQLEIEPDGTRLIMSQVGMYMAHNDPDPADPWSYQVYAHNFRSILHRRSTGGWSATAFKNLQPNASAFPTLIPDKDGRFQAFISDGGEIKRYAFGNGGWNRGAGTEWPRWIEHWGGFGAGQNWKRHPRIAVAGENLLLTVHDEWDGGIKFWVMEGKERRVELGDSGSLDPLAFHVGSGFRSLAARAYVQQIGNAREGYKSVVELQYHRWKEGDGRSEKVVLDTLESLGDSFFAPYQGGTALFAAGLDLLRIYSLDDSGRVDGRDTVHLPVDTATYNPIIAPDPDGCLHGLAWIPDTGKTSVRYAHWNSCAPGEKDTLSVPKPNPARFYLGNHANLRIAPDGTPVAAVLLREADLTDPSHQSQSWSDPTYLYLAEFRAGAWHLEKVDERQPPIPR